MPALRCAPLPIAALCAALLLLAATPMTAKAQDDVAVRPEDVETIDGVMAAFYEVVSGPVGEPRQWARDRTLWLPGAAVVPTRDGPDGAPQAEVLDPAGFAARTDEFLVREGFEEREIHRVTRRFGDIAHVFSTYEWKTAAGDTGRGVNSLELFHDGKRWWIAAAIWDSETAQDPIPPELLP